MSSSWNPSDANLSLELRAIAIGDPDMLALRLSSALLDCGCFLLEPGGGSVTQQVLNFEAPLWNLFGLYSTLQAADIELSRNSHESLTALCMLRHHPGIPYRARIITAQLTILLHNEVLDELPVVGFA